MSHFTVTVLVPGDTPHDEIEAAVEELLTPYDENMKVEPYEDGCGCVGLDAKIAARKSAEAEVGFDERKEVLLATPNDDRGDEWDERWDKMCDECSTAQDKLVDADPRKDAARTDCEECDGTGKYMSTYNPKSKWDWYQIGGRWDGMITDETVPCAPDCPAGMAKEHFGPHTAHGQNVRQASALRDDFSCYAVVTPDYEWHQKGNMGWWAVSTNEDPEWPECRKALFAKHGDCLAVLVDCHI